MLNGRQRSNIWEHVRPQEGKKSDFFPNTADFRKWNRGEAFLFLHLKDTKTIMDKGTTENGVIDY
jgi:hypothetical protein